MTRREQVRSFETVPRQIVTSGTGSGMLFGMSDVTQILSAIEQGDPYAAEQLLPLVYDELRQLAACRMAQEAPGQTVAQRPWPFLRSPRLGSCAVFLFTSP